jgi:hypothetical protein
MRLFHSGVAASTALVLTASACSSAFNSLPTPSYGVRSASINRAADSASTRDGYATLRLRIWVPGRTHDSLAHRALPAFVSSATRKVAVTVQGANQSSATTQKFRCTAVCSGKIVAPLGVDLITLQLEDKKKRVLSRGSATVLVFKQNGNVFDFTLDGVPANVSLVPESNTLPVVPASTGYLNFDARDADGRIITPDGHYVDANGNPLVFEVKSSNAAYRLAVKTVSAPGAPIPFFYNGTQHVGTVTLTAKGARGVHTTVKFHPTTLTLVPGISRRIQPPIPVQLMSATQVPVPASSTACGGAGCFDPNAIFLLGNAGGQSATLRFDVTDGAYGQAVSANTNGPFANPPIEYVTGFYGMISANGQLAYEYDSGNFAGYGTGIPNPCSGSPIGYNSANTLYCAIPGIFGSSVYDQTHSTFAANGQDRKIQEINGTTYLATVVQTTPAPTQQVWVSGSGTPVPGAISVGADPTNPATAYYGDFDGTVKRGTTTVATFSSPVENVLGNGTSIYVYESSGVFGVSGPSGKFESLVLPIGTVLEVVPGVNGVPMLVETNGMLDVMGI